MTSQTHFEAAFALFLVNLRKFNTYLRFLSSNLEAYWTLCLSFLSQFRLSPFVPKSSIRFLYSSSAALEYESSISYPNLLLFLTKWSLAKIQQFISPRCGYGSKEENWASNSNWLKDHLIYLVYGWNFLAKTADCFLKDLPLKQRSWCIRDSSLTGFTTNQSFKPKDHQ